MAITLASTFQKKEVRVQIPLLASSPLQVALINCWLQDTYLEIRYLCLDFKLRLQLEL